MERLDKIIFLKDGEKLMNVRIKSTSNEIDHLFTCKNTTVFYMLEEVIYELFPGNRQACNFFLGSGMKIDRLLNLDQNNIKDNEVILLVKQTYIDL